MLDRLAQLIVDRLRPQLESVIDDHFRELKEDIHNEMDMSSLRASNTLNAALPQMKKELKTEITQQIVRGIKS